MKESWGKTLPYALVFPFLTVLSRDLNKLSEELNDYKYTLQVLHSRVDEDDLELIKNVLAKHSSAG